MADGRVAAGANQPQAPELAAPVARSNRLESLDVLRGIAVLGILMPNLLAMALPSPTMQFPWLVYPDATAFDHAAMAFISIFCHGKFIFLFSLMFGVGAAVFADRKGSRSTRLWMRRMTVLLVLGVLHGTLLFFGDILTTYALAGIVLIWWCRRMRPKTGAIVGSILIMAGLFMYLIAMAGFGWQVGKFGLAESFGSTPAEEVALVQAGGLPAFERRAINYLFFLVFFPWLFLPLLGGVMLLGMAAMRSGIFAGSLGPKREGWIAALCLGLGLPASAVVYFALHRIESPIASSSWFAIGQAFAIPVGIGYAALVLRWVRTGFARGLRDALAAVGRMALSNYLLQSIIAVVLFDAIGFGLFGTLPLAALPLVAIAVWGVLFAWSGAWSAKFSRGPMEAIWRRLTYGRAAAR